MYIIKFAKSFSFRDTTLFVCYFNHKTKKSLNTVMYYLLYQILCKYLNDIKECWIMLDIINDKTTTKNFVKILQSIYHICRTLLKVSPLNLILFCSDMDYTWPMYMHEMGVFSTFSQMLQNYVSRLIRIFKVPTTFIFLFLHKPVMIRHIDSLTK